jgi:hypothetical protein
MRFWLEESILAVIFSGCFHLCADVVLKVVSFGLFVVKPIQRKHITYIAWYVSEYNFGIGPEIRSRKQHLGSLGFLDLKVYLVYFHPHLIGSFFSRRLNMLKPSDQSIFDLMFKPLRPLLCLQELASNLGMCQAYQLPKMNGLLVYIYIILGIYWLL